jgi:quercetin dioxygenase-like cupin family protein
MIWMNQLMVEGVEWGLVYKFDQGDVLPVHTHTEADNHITILVDGSVRVLGKHDGDIVRRGDLIIWNPNEPHGFEALQDNTLLVNMPLELFSA